MVQVLFRTVTGTANDVAMDILGRARVRQRIEEAAETITNSAQETFNRLVAQKVAITIALLCIVVLRSNKKKLFAKNFLTIKKKKNGFPSNYVS